MTYARPIRYRSGQTLRPCDICSIQYDYPADFVEASDGSIRCKRTCAPRGPEENEITQAMAQRRASFRASYPAEMPPPPGAKELSWVSSYMEEASLIDFLANRAVSDAAWPGGVRRGVPPIAGWVVQAGAGGPSGAYSIQGAAVPCVYLYSLIVEDKRPTGWITRAKDKLQDLADWLLTRQFGSPTGFASFVSGDTAYGGFSETGTAGTGDFYNAAGTSFAALALVYAYRLSGEAKYVAGARRAATCLRQLQRPGDRTGAAVFSTTTVGGSAPYHPGMWVSSATFDAVGNTLLDYSLTAGNLVGLVFLDALRTTDGDGTYGYATATSEYNVPTAATLSTMIAEAKAFWTTGVADVGSGTVKTGFSSATPYERFDPARSDGNGTGTWRYSQDSGDRSITGLNIAQALWGWFSLFGYDAKVADVWTWLMAFTSNTEFALPAAATPGEIASSQLGTYNPKLALATSLRVLSAAGAALKTNHTSLYEWATTGLLAAIQSAQDNASFATAKKELGELRFRYGRSDVRRDNPRDDLRRRGSSGLSFQTSYANVATESTVKAAMAGLIYRYPPQAFQEPIRP